MTDRLDSLIGEECDQVWFVQDYVQIWFHPLGLSCFAPPTIETEAETFRFPLAGSRDALCALIGAAMTSIERCGEDGLRISFANGSVLTVDVDPEHPEWDVWDSVERRW